MEISFSVITPSFNANEWIRACVCSVADQRGVTVQHIVEDGLSTDGTAEFVLACPSIEGESKADAGMYDAINQGWAKAKGEFVLHLNADEQLLPGALETVGRYFQQHPNIDVVLAGTLMCNRDGSLNCYRKALRPPMSILLTSHHPVQSCSIFFRRSSFADRPWLYDPAFRVGSDVLLMMDIVKEKKKLGLLHIFSSAFFLTGTNLGLVQGATAVEEYKHQLSLAPRWLFRIRHLVRAAFQFRKLLTGHYTHGPIEYDLYTTEPDAPRRRFIAPKPSGIYQPYKK